MAQLKRYIAEQDAWVPTNAVARWDGIAWVCQVGKYYDGVNWTQINMPPGECPSGDPAASCEKGNVLEVIDPLYIGASGPSGIAWDGTNLWVSTYPTTSIPEEIVRWFTPGNQISGGNISISTEYTARDITWDGTYLWYMDFRELHKVDVSNKQEFQLVGATIISSIKLLDGYGLTWDGTNLWAIISNAIYKIDPVTGNQLANIVSPTSYLHAIAWDGTNLWVAGSETNTDIVILYKLDPAIGNILDQINIPSQPLTGMSVDVVEGLTYDGSYLWIVAYDDNANSVIYKVCVG